MCRQAVEGAKPLPRSPPNLACPQSSGNNKCIHVKEPDVTGTLAGKTLLECTRSRSRIVALRSLQRAVGIDHEISCVHTNTKGLWHRFFPQHTHLTGKLFGHPTHLFDLLDIFSLHFAQVSLGERLVRLSFLLPFLTPHELLRQVRIPERIDVVRVPEQTASKKR